MTNKVALVTGGSKGIGKEIAIKLAKEGIDLVINYNRDIKKAEEVRDICIKYNVKVLLIKADVSKIDEVDNMFEKIKEEFKFLDILVNNAGITRDSLVLTMKEEDFKDVLDVNLLSVFYTSKKALRLMRKKTGASIINISSIVGLKGNIGQANYAASKAGVIGFSKSLAREMASRDIRVNVVAPGFIDTDMTSGLSEDIKETLISNIPLKRLGQAEDIANLVCFLASENSSYITGQVISCDGGMNI